MTNPQIAERFLEIRPPLAPDAAHAEAERCLYCFNAPCTRACPTHIDVPGFIKRIGTRDLRGSALTILDANVLGLSCARVCPVDVLCEGSCVMHGRGERPIEIGRLQRHAMEHFYASGSAPSQVLKEIPLSVACIGAGPASLACGAELRKHGVQVTLFERRPLPGGLNTYGVADYKLRARVSLEEIDFVRSLGVRFEMGRTVGVDLALEDLERGYDSIFIGVGLGPGKPLEGSVDSVEFIAAYKTGDPFPVPPRVVVIGGGNTAIDAAVAAKLLGAEEVNIAYRRGEGEISAFPFEYDHARQVGVTFLWWTKPCELSNGVLRYERAGASGEMYCDLLIRAIGQTPAAEALLVGRGIQITSGRVVVDRATGRTANPRYYAGGDCVNGGREVVDAVADGKRAARGILEAFGG